ncbi:hypothetical protein [Burkholderia sp. MSMB1498]|uniref:hypothetical protein n=1 Tax=Burkholderia sp. MSMB1498 TaxID=1637842 RepID=UPI000AF2F1C7|nr:hypothetical protein [Burkholderia sp. MSMB1498]
MNLFDYNWRLLVTKRLQPIPSLTIFPKWEKWWTMGLSEPVLPMANGHRDANATAAARR